MSGILELRLLARKDTRAAKLSTAPAVGTFVGVLMDGHQTAWRFQPWFCAARLLKGLCNGPAL